MGLFNLLSLYRTLLYFSIFSLERYFVLKGITEKVYIASVTLNSIIYITDNNNLLDKKKNKNYTI